MTPLLLMPLAFAVGDVPSPRIDSQVERAFYLLADLTPAEAGRLEGKRARFLVTLDSLEHVLTHSYDCLAPPGLAAGVYLRLGQEAADSMVVEGRLWVIDHAPGLGFPPLRECRVVDAVRLR
jgi:hypothetical protein